MNKFIFELLFVGISSGIAGLFISTIFMILTVKNFNFKTYTFWPQIVISYFVTGILLHLLFEFFGFNKWYCQNGKACKNI